MLTNRFGQQTMSICMNYLFSEYAVLRLLGMSGLKLYKTAANAAVRIQSYPDNQEYKPIR